MSELSQELCATCDKYSFLHDDDYFRIRMTCYSCETWHCKICHDTNVIHYGTFRFQYDTVWVDQSYGCSQCEVIKET